MKAKIFSFKTMGAYAATLALLLTASCSTDMESAEPTIGADGATKLSLNASIDAETRVSVDGVTVKWAKNDVIYANSAENEFVTTDAGANVTFAGEIEITETQPLYVVFDLTSKGANFSADSKSYTVPQNLSAFHKLAANTTTNTASLGRFLFLYGVTNEVSSTTTSIDVNMKHGTAVQDFTITGLDFSEGNYLANLTLTSDEPFLDEITYDIATGARAEGASTITSIPLTINTSDASGGSYVADLLAITEMTVRMPILPQTIASTATWTVTISTTNGDVYNYTYPDATSDFTYEAGTCYNLTLDLGDMEYIEYVAPVEPDVVFDVTTVTAEDLEGLNTWNFNNATLASGNIDNLNTILSDDSINAEDITVVFYKLESILAKVFQSTEIVNAEFPEVTSINAANIFEGSKIQRLSMPKVTSDIGSYAFANCENLVAINAPDGEVGVYFDGVEKITTYVFLNCPSITTMSFSSITSFGNQAFRNCSSLKYFNATDEHPGINIEGISSVSDYSFTGCTSIVDIYAPDASYLGAQALGGLSSLETLEVGTSESVTYLYSGASLIKDTQNGITTPTENVALVTGSNNGTEISETTWKVANASGTFLSYSFASITTK